MNNMELEDIVCSLEHAKRLAELGVYQLGSFFYWKRINNKWSLWDANELYEDEYYAALTASEIGKMLPVEIQTENWVMNLLFVVEESQWTVCYYEKSVERIAFTDSNEANARAMMLIYLLENKIIEVSK